MANEAMHTRLRNVEEAGRRLIAAYDTAVAGGAVSEAARAETVIEVLRRVLDGADVDSAEAAVAAEYKASKAAADVVEEQSNPAEERDGALEQAELDREIAAAAGGTPAYPAELFGVGGGQRGIDDPGLATSVTT